MFENKVAVVTGGAKGTGKVIADYGYVDYLINFDEGHPRMLL